MKNISLSVIVIMSLLLPACHKSEVTLPINPELKAAFNFQPGTYWIYKDSISGRIDSFFVSSRALYPNDPLPTGSGTTADAIDINISDYTNGVINSDSTYWQMVLEENLLSAVIVYPNYNQDIYYNPLLYIPFSLNSLILVNTYPSFFLNGQTYSNVIQISQKSLVGVDSFGSYSDCFYINESVGIIKMNLHHYNSYRVWELQKNNIIK